MHEKKKKMGSRENSLLTHLEILSLEQIHASVAVTEAQAAALTTYKDTCRGVQSCTQYKCQQ